MQSKYDEKATIANIEVFDRIKEYTIGNITKEQCLACVARIEKQYGCTNRFLPIAQSIINETERQQKRAVSVRSRSESVRLV